LKLPYWITPVPLSDPPYKLSSNNNNFSMDSIAKQNAIPVITISDSDSLLTENSWWSKLKTSIAMNLFSILIQELNLIPDLLAKEHHTQRYLDVLLTTNPISFASKMQLCMTFLTEKYRLKPWLKKILKALQRSVNSVAAKVLTEKENQGEAQTIRYLELFQNQFQEPL
jgi:hypothetical protein